MLLDQGQARLAAITGDPVGIRGMDFGGGAQKDFLHVAPAEGGVGLEHEGDDTGNDGSGGGGSVEGVGIVFVAEVAGRAAGVVAVVAGEIGGDDAGGRGLSAGRAYDDVGAAFTVGGGYACVGERADGDDVDVVGRGTFIALVAVGFSVTGGKDVDRAQAAATIGRAIGDGIFPKRSPIIQPIFWIVISKSIRPPAVVFDLDGRVSLPPVHRVGFVLVGDIVSGDYAQTIKRGFGGYARHADAIIQAGGDEAGDGSAVKIRFLGNIWRGIGIAIDPVVVSSGGDVADQIGMIELQACIDDGDADSGAF